MPKRIHWEKGMRLTDAILRASDDCSADLTGLTVILASAGRFGLFPCSRPFDLELSISRDGIDIVALQCLATTKDGHLIDVDFDSRYTNRYDSRVTLPDGFEEGDFLLSIYQEEDRWKAGDDGFEEPVYTFSLNPANTPVADYALPIAHFVNNERDKDFVPPCLFISSHPRYTDLFNRFQEVLQSLDAKVRKLLLSSGKDTFRLFWPLLQQLIITVDKERDTMTPMSLLGYVQKCISAFICACDLDENVRLSDAERLRQYVQIPYNYQKTYQHIKEGLNFCFDIDSKIGRIQEVREEPPSRVSVPVISEEACHVECKTTQTSVAINYQDLDTDIYFTIDGSEPSTGSTKAVRLGKSFYAKFENDFSAKKSDEPDRHLTMKLKAYKDGASSATATYQVTLKKGLNFRNAIKV